MRVKPNTGLIQRLQRHLDTDTPMTKSIFVDEGSISKDCEAVLTYIGDNFIQSLKTGEWLASINGKRTKSKDVKAIEEKVWKSYKSKLQ